MAVSGQGTTYNLPNYHGELFEISPVDTPFLSAIGGLSGAKTTTATQFEWQTVDRRASSANNTALEGAALPAGAERVRSNVDNVVEIHQSAIELSYTKMAATGQFSGANIAPQSDDATINEVAQQTTAELQSMAVDIEKSFLTGTYQKPTDNTTARKTQGILGAITTNVINAEGASLGAPTIVASTGVFTLSAHGLSVGEAVDIGAATSTTGFPAGQTRYYVLTVPSSSTFTLSSTPVYGSSGTALVLTTNGSIASIVAAPAVSKAAIDATLQLAFNSGAMAEAGVIMCNHFMRPSISNAYSAVTLNQPTLTRNIGGVAMDTLITDFGTLGIMTNRWMPPGELAFVDLSVCAPVFLEIPDKGLLFVEEMPQLGASRRWQLYGEIGLEYGPQLRHALLTGVS